MGPADTARVGVEVINPKCSLLEGTFGDLSTI